MIEVIKKFLIDKFSTLYFFYQYIGRKIYLLFGFSMLMVIMDSVGLTLFIPLLQIADGGNSGLVGESSGKIELIITRVFNTLGLSVNIANMLLLIIFIFVAKGVFFYFSSKFNALAQQTVSLKMRTRLANSVKNLNYKEFVSTDIGRLQNTIIAEVWKVIGACMQYLETIKNVVLVAVYLSFAFFMDWRFSLLVILGGILTNGIYRFFYTRTQELSRAITRNNHRYGAIVIEVINHFKYFKATGRSQDFFGRLQTELEKLIQNNISVAKLGAKLAAIREPMTIIIICFVIYLHVKVFNSPLSGVMIILLFFYRIMQKVVEIQATWNSFLVQTGAVENVIDFQKYLDENKDIFYVGKTTISQIESLVLKNIRVSYGDIPVLKNINLTINKNDSIAFVGESGSGKTTLVNLLTTLLSFGSGEFLVNGKDIQTVDIESYKIRVGYISQEPTVFNGSIYDNVTFWAERTEENLKKFYSVIEMCSLSKFLNELDSKEDTLLGNNGLNISGGQKQRISIARELFRDVDILIMDEATSALDSETENDIKLSLESIKGKVTIISIAHRLSTVRHADCLYLMEKGEILASGSFDELKNKSGYFRRLTELQGM